MNDRRLDPALGFKAQEVPSADGYAATASRTTGGSDLWYPASTWRTPLGKQIVISKT